MDFKNKPVSKCISKTMQNHLTVDQRPPCVGASPPIYIRQPRECEPRGPGEACLSSQLGKIVRETFLPRRTLCTEDPLPLRAWHYERSGLGCNPSFRVESLSPFGLLRLRAQQRELLTKCWLCTGKKERK
ncbi:hypothetical protein CEXT_634091 [Caerostris extrusa]|uniref:Uncharacterized protein n=1 Tax=Caerostris extrusa TaxID=172846 RepID=A0AAV4REL9_CAEEX|nr:hypothetical protein CEXT_634091 [Caerostris extrusa]